MKKNWAVAATSEVKKQAGRCSRVWFSLFMGSGYKNSWIHVPWIKSLKIVKWIISDSCSIQSKISKNRWFLLSQSDRSSPFWGPPHGSATRPPSLWSTPKRVPSEDDLWSSWPTFLRFHMRQHRQHLGSIYILYVYVYIYYVYIYYMYIIYIWYIYIYMYYLLVVY